jgi:aspartate/methionine/tyrosine aminotransferase
MFSSRIAWDLRPNPLARLLSAKRKAGIEVLDLTESNPTRAGFEYPEEEILAALQDPRALTYEPAPWGLTEPRDAVAARHEVGVERVMLTASTSESYAYLFKLLCNPGDEVLAPRPSYPLFEFLGALESVVVRQYPLVYEGEWRVDFDALEALVTGRTRAVMLVNPNNPTGSFLKRGELERLVSQCASRGLAIISDEVFADFGFGEDGRRVRSLVEVEDALTFCLSGLSKVSGLPQMKVGWILAGGPPALRADAMERLELIADTYLSVATPQMHALPHWLEAGERVRGKIRDRTRSNLRFLEGIKKALVVEGGWYAILDVANESMAQDLLEQDDVLVQPGFFFDFSEDRFIVVSLLTPKKTFREGVRRIASVS